MGLTKITKKLEMLSDSIKVTEQPFRESSELRFPQINLSDVFRSFGFPI